MRTRAYFLATAFASTVMAGPSLAATTLTSVSINGPSGTVWNTTQDGFYTVFLQRPFGNVLNPNDNFTGSATTTGGNNFVIAGDGFPGGRKRQFRRSLHADPHLCRWRYDFRGLHIQQRIPWRTVLQRDECRG